ncbi:hypothetical protein HBH86_053430 [Parastagonospora nodorum]|nr:hypothetical protein HBH93_043660 [Parastagonospora nodorum]KAH4564824.1 hypothetical protein HBH86_053430 [Parastagonospora nodorum]
MLQTNVREGYRITTLEVIELIEDLISYLQNAQISKVFYKAAYSAKVKIEDLSNMLMLILSKTAQRRSLSVVSNRSTALITNKFGVASLTKLAILNNANVALVDAVHYSQKLEENYFEVRAQHLKYNVIDALTITLIKDDDDLLGTVNSYIKPPLKRCKTEAADSRYAKASRGRTKKDKDLEDSNTSSDVLRLRRRDRAAACAQLAERKHLLDSDDYCLDSSSDINSKDDLEDEEATIAKDLAREQKERLKALLNAKTLHSRRLIDAYILYFKELLSNNGGIFANAIGMGKTQAIVLAVLIRHCDLSDLLALQFCFFSDSLPENIGRLTKEEVIEMRIDTTNAISKALAATNKLVALQSYTILEANTPAVHSKAIKHRLALLAAQFVIVCGFRKVDKHVFRAYNTISVTAQQTIIRKGSSYVEKRVILLPSYVTFNATNKRDSVTSDRIYKIEDAVYRLIAETLSYRTYFLSIVQNAEQQCRDILEKEGLNKSEASRRDYFLSIAAEDTAKAANILLPPKEVRAKILIESYKPIVQARDLDRPWIIVALIAFAEAITLTEATHVLAEMCVSIVYFNLDSELELKVLSKQDVKTTS